MEYILIIVVIVIFFFLKKLQDEIKENKLLLKHSIISLNYYEKFLLKNNILSQEDINESRKIIENNLSKTEFEKLKNLILSTDIDYSGLLEEILLSDTEEDVKSSAKTFAKDAVYYKNNRNVREILKAIENKNIKNYVSKDEEDHLTHSSVDSWINHKYGKNYFYPDSE